MPGMDAECVARIEGRAEMRQAADMIVMGMGEEDIGIDRLFRIAQCNAERAHAGAGVVSGTYVRARRMR